MENKTRKYYNRSTLTGVERGTVGAAGHKVLKLRFTAWDRDTKEQVNKYHTMFLTQENNDRNQQTLMTLGVERPPEIVSFDEVARDGALAGIGKNVVDLVAEENDAGYENVKYINEPKFDLKVFDMAPKAPKGDIPF